MSKVYNIQWNGPKQALRYVIPAAWRRVLFAQVIEDNENFKVLKFPVPVRSRRPGGQIVTSWELKIYKRSLNGQGEWVDTPDYPEYDE